MDVGKTCHFDLPTVAVLRKAAGLTPEQMSVHLGMARVTYHERESGRRRFQADEWTAAARLWHRDPAAVLLAQRWSVDEVAETLGRPRAEIEQIAEALAAEFAAGAAGEDAE